MCVWGGQPDDGCGPGIRQQVDQGGVNVCGGVSLMMGVGQAGRQRQARPVAGKLGP